MKFCITLAAQPPCRVCDCCRFRGHTGGGDFKYTTAFAYVLSSFFIQTGPCCVHGLRNLWPDVSTARGVPARYVHGPICPRLEVSLSRRVSGPICPRFVSLARYVHASICPWPDMSTARGVPGPMCSWPDMSTARGFPGSMCPLPDVSTARYVGVGQPVAFTHIWTHRDVETSSDMNSSIRRMRFTTQWRTAFRVKSFKAVVINEQLSLWHLFISGAGIMEADDRQVTTVFTVQPSVHYRHSTNPVS